MNKTLSLLILCLLFFAGGWALHDLYSRLKPPIVETQVMQQEELGETLKLIKGKLAEVAIIEEKDMGSYVQRHLRFRWQGFPNEAYLLIPHKIGDKMPTILALPGHHTSKEEVIGNKSSRFGVDYGKKLVIAGYCVFVPDIPFSDDMRVEDHIALNLIMTGSSLTGLRVSYLRDLIDYLTSLPFIDPERLGCVGWSMGGGLAMYLAAVDTRIKAAAISNYFGTYKDTFMRMRQSTDNYIPGILQFGEMADVACLIAPRSLWFEHSKEDPEFPREAFMRGIEDLKRCYESHQDHLSWQLISGGHRFEGKGLEEWFKRWL